MQCCTTNESSNDSVTQLIVVLVQIAKKLMERGIPAVPKIYFHVGDVRDVAAAHIKGMTVAEAAGSCPAQPSTFQFFFFFFFRKSHHQIAHFCRCGHVKFCDGRNCDSVVFTQI